MVHYWVRWFRKKMLLRKAVTGAICVIVLILFARFFSIRTGNTHYDVEVPIILNISGEEIHKSDLVPSSATDNIVVSSTVVDGPDRTKLVQFTEDRLLSIRYWDLANSSSRGSSSNRVTLPNLWRPQRGNLSRDDDRVLAQLVWAMEFKGTPNTKLSTNISSVSRTKIKIISLASSFRWWNRYDWHGSYTIDEKECPGMPGLWGRCVLVENSVSDADATIGSSVYVVGSSSNNLLKFAYILESPFVYSSTFSQKDHLMATYFRGSDINTPYGKWVYYDPAVRFKDQEKDYSKGKSKMAAIFTSNCGPNNDRLGYVRELKKYVEVDVFGSCGTKRCPRSLERQCFEMLSKEYHFYLSFENANCRDYATEKLFLNGLENDVIPIVMGAHPQDYLAMCPEKSYIHIEDFANPKELANYMNYLKKNPEAYNSYFRWKGTGTFLNTRFFCRVCAMVHYADVVPPPEWKQSLSWNAGNGDICLPRRQWYWINKDHRFTTTTTTEVNINR